MYEIQKDLQVISDFLAHRNCDKNSMSNADILVIAGNSMPTIAKYASVLYHEKIAPTLLVCGGIGHSTNLLYENMEKCGYGKREQWHKKSEAECLRYVLETNGVEKKDILLEMKSTNTGENASYTKEVLVQREISITSMVLLQDPILQLRTYATFQKVFPSLNIRSYAPFRPTIHKEGFPVKDEIEDVWDKQRFLSLLMGELQRVYDDQNGYGPCGKNYMNHVDMPKEIYNAWQRVKQYLQGKVSIER